MDLYVILLLIAGLLIVVSVMQPMATRLGLAHSVLLAVVGVAIGLVSGGALHTSVLIDPVKERVDRYLGVLAYHRLELEMVIDTHTHADHRTGVWDVRELTGAKVVMHKRAPAPHIDLHVSDGDQLEVGSLPLGFIYTPGHAPDGVCIRVGSLLFTGDTLLVRLTGRTDFPGGDAGEQYDAITRKLFTLPDETKVFPAHDYRGNVCSTIGEEKRLNSRIAGRSREAYIALMNNLGMPLPEKIQEALQANVSAIDDDSVKFPSYAHAAQDRARAGIRFQLVHAQGCA